MQQPTSTNRTLPISSSDEFPDLAPLPKTLEETGLSINLLTDLTLKHLVETGVISLPELAKRLALSGSVLEEILGAMRKEALVQVLGGNDASGSLRFGLTERGRHNGLDALTRNGYVGPAPIPLYQYARVARSQTVHKSEVTKDLMSIAFKDMVIDESLLDQLGPAVTSGRAIFIYGPAGTGKTYVTQKLARLFSDEVLVPYAVAVNDSMFTVFDPIAHKPIVREAPTVDLRFSKTHDPRWVACERPVLVSGGELTAEMLEIQHDLGSREYRAPLQLKANNGIYIIDDMGRQRVTPEEIFNRWIVPMEEKKDYLNLGSGRTFSVPFDLVLVFSTNLNPEDLADEAFLRRIGYKIRFGYLTESQYQQIWNDVCLDRDIQSSKTVVEHVIRNLHVRYNVPLLPCHPRDLIGIALDHANYMQRPAVLTNELMDWAWHNYFVSLHRGGSQSVGSNNLNPQISEL